ncbi:hypothetical protein L7F22_033649 [Adiantum nelumboides]|nr:hypothetical protein [Adiantum nelumboides]
MFSVSFGMFGASQVAAYSCGADANWWIERWFGDCVYTTWDTIAFLIGLSSVCFWLIAQLPQFISNFVRSAADALSPWFLAQWLAGDTFNFLGCVLTGDQLKTQIITAGYFIFSDIVIISQYVYYQVRNRKAINFDESVHKSSAYTFVPKGNHSRESAVENLDFHTMALGDNLAGLSAMPASFQRNVVSEHVVSNKSILGSCPANEFFEPLNCIQLHQVSVPPALSNLRHQDGWMYEHRHRLRRLSQEYNLEYGHAFSKRFAALYNIRKEKHQTRKALKNLNKTRYKAVLGIAGLFGIVLIPRIRTFSRPDNSQYSKGGFAVGRRALLALHGAGAHLEMGQPSAALLTGRLLSLSPQAYPWTMMVGRSLGWGSSALYLGSRFSQLIKNKQRQSAEGLSLGMVTCAVLANITYGASIIMRGPSWDNLIGKAPWIVGSFGTVFLDFSIFIQAYYYGWRSKNGDPNEYTPLLS